MPATQVFAHPVVAEMIRNVLSTCRCTLTSREYPHRLVETIASVTHSQYAVWLNWPGRHCVVAETEGFPWRNRVLSLCECVPRLSGHAGEDVHSIAASPIMFRSSITGVLAIANGALPYTTADLHFLDEIGRSAVLDYESLERAEALGIASPRQKTVDLVHKLRQPLGVLEACAFYLDLILPAGEDKARNQLVDMQRQLHRASGILDESLQIYPPCDPGPGLEAPEPTEAESRVFTKSAMSIVT